MKVRIGLVKACVLGALLSGAIAASTAALAQELAPAGGSATGATYFTDGLPTSTEWTWGVEPTPANTAPFLGKASQSHGGWWTHGVVEFGGRDFVNNPQKSGLTAFGGKSLSSYYEYSDIAPGPFGDFDVATGTNDGLYQLEIGGANVGYDDQSFFLDWSEIGVQYFVFTYDQTPHLYSTNALSPYVVNGDQVTFAPGVPKTATTAALLAPYAAPVALGIHRDTASFAYRWTPDEAWDLNLDYSYMSRTGTQPSEVAESNAKIDTQYAKPVDDSTQNYSANGEYVGMSPWGKRYVFSLGYSGSQYHDNITNVFVQAAPGSSSFAIPSTWPSNQANGATATLAADLPWQSRYVGTLEYSAMTQNAAFPATNTGAGGQYLPEGLPSLNGEINTTLTDNVLTTKISPFLTAKSTFRYYDFDNATPELAVLGATTGVDTAGSTDDHAATTAHTISMGYTKTNAGEALNWRPDRYWNLGAAYGYERYDWTRADVDVTNQNSGSAFIDYDPWIWLTSRASVEYSSRRYENYDYFGYVGDFQWDTPLCSPTATATCVSDEYANSQQQLMIDNRDVWDANYSVNVIVIPNLTLTPWTKYQDQKYGVDPYTQQGLEDSNSWDFGVDGTYVIDHSLSIMAGYSASYAHEDLVGSTCAGPVGSAPTAHGATCTTLPYAYSNLANALYTNERSVVNTFTTAVRYVPIPGRLDTELRYNASLGVDDMAVSPVTNLESGTTQFPANNVWFQRVDATATYTFDRQKVAQLGWRGGDVKLKFRYTWESNSQTDWANDPLSPYTTAAQMMTDCGTSGCLWMGWFNPDYNVQMVSAALLASW
jgi:MtrB/PioB family decaheme-associated outer membrane protein